MQRSDISESYGLQPGTRYGDLGAFQEWRKLKIGPNW